MNRQDEHITKARLVDGKVLIEQAGGTIREAADRTDAARLDALSDDDIDRMAGEDGEDEVFPKDQPPTRVSQPFEPAE